MSLKSAALGGVRDGDVLRKEVLFHRGRFFLTLLDNTVFLTPALVSQPGPIDGEMVKTRKLSGL